MQTIIDVPLQAGRSAIEVALYTLLPIMVAMRAEERVVDGTIFMATIWYQTFKDPSGHSTTRAAMSSRLPKPEHLLHLGFTRRQMAFERQQVGLNCRCQRLRYSATF